MFITFGHKVLECHAGNLSTRDHLRRQGSRTGIHLLKRNVGGVGVLEVRHDGIRIGLPIGRHHMCRRVLAGSDHVVAEPASCLVLEGSDVGSN